MHPEYPRPNSDRARYACLVLYLILGCHALGVLLTLCQFGAGSFMPDTLWPVITGMIGLVGVAQLVIYILCIIFFIKWFRRAYNNLYIVGSRNLSFSEGWASGAWFVPFVNLGRPYRIMKEIWTETQLIGRTPQEGYVATEPVIVGWWWAAWLTGNVVSNLSLRMEMGSIHVDYSTMLAFSLLGDTLSISAGLMLISIIKKVNVWEEDLKTRYMNYIVWQQQQQYTQQQYAQDQHYQQQQQYPQQPYTPPQPPTDQNRYAPPSHPDNLPGPPPAP